MCGRYAATANPDELVEEFEVDDDRTLEPVRSILKNPQNPPPGTPDWNMAPSKQAPVVLTRVPDAGSAQETALLEHLRTGGRALLFGSTDRAGDRLLGVLGLTRAEPVEGTLELRRDHSVDRLATPAGERTRLVHRSLLSDGPIATVLRAAGPREGAAAARGAPHPGRTK